jgi:hypothetical protein
MGTPDLPIAKIAVTAKIAKIAMQLTKNVPRAKSQEPMTKRQQPRALTQSDKLFLQNI